MPRRAISDDLRRVSVTISMPKYLATALEELPNKSEVVTQILEENADRIFAGDVVLAGQYIETRIKEELMNRVSLARREFTKSEEISKLVEEMNKVVKLANRLKIDFRDIEREARNLVMDMRNEKCQINRVIRETLEEMAERLKEEMALNKFEVD